MLKGGEGVKGFEFETLGPIETTEANESTPSTCSFQDCALGRIVKTGRMTSITNNSGFGAPPDRLEKNPICLIELTKCSLV
jgi:hypothetical protein